MDELKENPTGWHKKKDYLLPFSILAGAVLISGAVIYSTGFKAGGGEASLEKAVSAGSPKIEADDVILGDPEAKVALIEYGDYQCPFCGRFFKTVEPILREDYIKTGKAKMVWKDFVFLGPESEKSAEAARCAADQGKFWEYHDAILNIEADEGWKENNGNLTEAKLKSVAGSLNLDVKAFNVCFESGKHKEQVENSYRDAVRIGVKATPTVFIGETKIEGAQSYEVFKEAIDIFFKK